MNPSESIFPGYGSHTQDFYQSLIKEIETAQEIDLIVSFLMESGVRLLIRPLKEALARGAKIRILTGEYLGITQPSALWLLKMELQNQVKIHLFENEKISFHPKAYFFKNGKKASLYIGSSNLSYTALKKGVEWNYRLDSDHQKQEIEAFHEYFEDLFENYSAPLSDEKLESLSRKWKKPQIGAFDQIVPASDGIVPRDAQIQALYLLRKAREDGLQKGLVQAATGIGKTYLAAFDSLPFQKVLFVAHRQEILEQAARTFQTVRNSSVGFFSGNSHQTDTDILFASVQMLSKKNYLNKEYFNPEQFDYIIIDEFHHAAAPVYQRILQYFKPRFLLGLTATPERLDGRDVYSLLDYNVIFELSLFQAIQQGLLVPFHYYGIYDSTDYSGLKPVQGKYRPQELGALYQDPRYKKEREHKIINAFRKYSPKKSVGFCSSIEHTVQMSGLFSAHGITARPFHSRLSASERKERLDAFSKGKIQVLFVVDIFNEGIDIPDIDAVLFLRPTESATIFFQQLGRGLRKSEGKDHLLVLDWIGNYQNAYRIPSYFQNDSEQKGFLIPQERYLPQGCRIDFDLELIQLLEKLQQQEKGKPKPKGYYLELLKKEYFELKEKLGHRPLRVELYNVLDEELLDYLFQHAGINPFRNYLSFLDSLNELQKEETEWIEKGAGKILNDLETTSMSRVYKIPVLLSLAGRDRMKLSVSQKEMLAVWKDFFSRDRNWRDLFLSRKAGQKQPATYHAYLQIPDAAHLANILKNPVRYLQKSHPDLFVFENSRFGFRRELKELISTGFFLEQYQDILSLRKLHYYRTRYQSNNR